MANVGIPDAATEMREIQAAAGTLGINCAALEIRRAEDIKPAFDRLKMMRATALFVVGDP
jgi:hypothetical protein